MENGMKSSLIKKRGWNVEFPGVPEKCLCCSLTVTVSTDQPMQERSKMWANTSYPWPPKEGISSLQWKLNTELEYLLSKSQVSGKKVEEKEPS